MAGISEEVTKEYVDKILYYLGNNNIFAAKLTLKKILSFPGNGFKIIRRVYIILYASSYKFYETMQAVNNGEVTWDGMRVSRLFVTQTFTKLLMEFDQQGVIKPGKFYTLPKLNYFSLGSDPTVFKYLFNSGRFQLSKSFTFTGYQLSSETSLSTEDTYYFMGAIRRLSKDPDKLKFIIAMGFEPAILADPIKLKLAFATNIQENLLFIISKFISEHPNLTDKALLLLIQEFTTADFRSFFVVDPDHQPEPEEKCLFRGIYLLADSIIEQMVNLLPGSSVQKLDYTFEDIMVISNILRKRISDNLQTIVSTRISGNIDSDSVLKKHNIDLQSGSLFNEKVQNVMEGLLGKVSDKTDED